MTFLQPWIFWGVPLVLLPILIHLLNRLRHRPQPWAAMRFLLNATRTSTSQAKLKQFLILLMRVLALLALIFFLARPLAGGWLGWALAPAPDVILLLMDRSASMETRVSEGGETRREQSLRLFTEAARPFEGASQIVLMDSTGRAPQTLAKISDLATLGLLGPTDTAADVPSLVQSALRWLLENKAGTAELWIASDLQKSNWRPEDPRWRDLSAQMRSLPQKVRVRLLAANGRSGPNRSVRLEEVLRRKRSGRAELALTLDFQRTERGGETVPVGMIQSGSRTTMEVTLDSQDARWRHALGLDSKTGSGWGKVELPADANGSDNAAYFVYSEETPLRAAVVGRDGVSTRVLSLAAAWIGQGTNTPARLDRGEGGVWDRETLVVWQEPLPQGSASEQLRRWVQEGGVALFFPPAAADTNRFEGFGWGEQKSSTETRPFRVVKWDENQGPLAKTDEGLSLPLSQTAFFKRQAILGGGTTLAAFDDGMPLLVRQVIGKGEIYFCGSLPNPAWSSLMDGPVLVPMVQRLLVQGARRLQSASAIACGELGLADQSKAWVSIDAPGKDIRLNAGVYRLGERWLAVNRSKLEDDTELMDHASAPALFGENAVRLWEGRESGGESAMQGEVWRMFLACMLAFLMIEAWLVLPPAAPSGARVKPVRAGGGAS